MLATWFNALRIRHWVKNFFVLIPFLVGPYFGLNDALVVSLAGVLLFGMMSSAVYLFNDVTDVRSDREHPEKRFRPVASGRISMASAIAVSIVLAVSCLLISFALDRRFFLVVLCYALNNVLYTYYLKTKTVIDVISIATGFVLRTYAGGFLIGLDITKWLVACVFVLSLFLGFGKRRAELGMLSGNAAKVRLVHQSYSVATLDLFLAASAAMAIMCYMLYSLSPEALQVHRTDEIILTTPFVVYCIFRYVLKVQEAQRGDPFEILLTDRGFLLGGLSWLVLLIVIIHP